MMKAGSKVVALSAGSLRYPVRVRPCRRVSRDAAMWAACSSCDPLRTLDPGADSTCCGLVRWCGLADISAGDTGGYAGERPGCCCCWTGCVRVRACAV